MQGSLIIIDTRKRNLCTFPHWIGLLQSSCLISMTLKNIKLDYEEDDRNEGKIIWNRRFHLRGKALNKYCFYFMEGGTMIVKELTNERCFGLR